MKTYLISQQHVTAKNGISGNSRTYPVHFLRKKTITIFMIPVMLAFISCSISRSKEHFSSEITSGIWIDDNTFRVKSTGVSNKKLTNITQMKYSSRRDALLNAQYKIKESFKSWKKYEMKQAGFDQEDFDPQIKDLIAKVKGEVNSGKIVEESYDENNDCTIIFEVNYHDLKKNCYIIPYI